MHLQKRSPVLPPPPQQALPNPEHQPQSASDFGGFASASASSSRPTSASADQRLSDDDLLGSFDEEVPRHLASASPRLTQDSVIHDWWQINEASGSRSQRPTTVPMRVPLPPRPSEISPDYVPPLRSPRRLSQPYVLAGPGSPPLVSDAGNEIVFHPSAPSIQNGQRSGLASSSRRLSFGRPEAPERLQHDRAFTDPTHHSDSYSPAHSKLLNTLASTTKIASKWKSVLEHSTSPHVSQANTMPDPAPTPTALPIDITHTTPFASSDQVAGSFVSPTGAPGFYPVSSPAHPHAVVGDQDWLGTKLLGRRDTTSPVMLQSDADQLRKCLPPRQRMSTAWTLLFSIDQHGASLASLYRLIDKFTAGRRGLGNVLIVLASNGMRFGVFMNEAITRKDGTYYGSGESFLFRLDPGVSVPRTYRWTGKNQYFALCEGGFISFGGGAGAYGLLLDSSFARNSSATCPAYDNEVLCLPGGCFSDIAVAFDCLGVEVWATSSN